MIKNTFAGIESDCMLRFGFKALIKSILYTQQKEEKIQFIPQVRSFSLGVSIMATLS